MSLPDEQQPNSCRDDETAVKDQSLDANQPRVGYKNPPTKNQFKGSGNPGGRPKKKPALDFDTRIIEFLEAKLPNSQKMGLDLLLSTLAKHSAQGDVRATKYLFELYRDAKRRTRHSGVDLEADQQAAEQLFASLSSFSFESTAEGATSEKKETSSEADE